METGAEEILLRVQERKQWAREYARIEVVTSADDGAVTPGELASITDGFEETGFHGEFNRQPTVDLEIYRAGDQSPLTIAAIVERALEEAEPSFPPGVRYHIDSNTADDYRSRLTLLPRNGALAAVIVLLILAVFSSTGWRSG